MGAGIGAAMLGLRPVIEIMTINFILTAMDQVINHAAKIRYMFGGTVGVPLVIRAPGGAGAQLTAQHSQSLEAWFAGCPGLKVVAPANPADAYGMLKTAIRDDDPVLFCENLVMYNVTGSIPDDPEFTVPFGQAQVAPRGRRSDHRGALLHRPARASGRRSTGPGRSRGRGGRPALAAAARRRHRGRLGAQDQPCADRRGGLVDLRGRRRARPPASRACASTISTHRSNASDRPRCRCRTPSRWSGPHCRWNPRSKPQRGICCANAGSRKGRMMAEELVMPRLSDTMEEGTIGRWLKQEGDAIKEGDVLAEIETDKATMEFQAYADGTLLKILVGDGETVALGAPIALVGEQGERSARSSGSRRGGSRRAADPRAHPDRRRAGPLRQWKRRHRDASDQPDRPPHGGSCRYRHLDPRRARLRSSRAVKADVERAIEAGGTAPAAAATAAVPLRARPRSSRPATRMSCVT